MAYNQSPLQNIGDIRNKILKRKLERKFGTEEGARKFQEIEDFRARAAQRKQPKFKTVETSFVDSVKPFERQTIKFDVPEETKKREKSKNKVYKSKVKTKKPSGGVIREKSGEGKKALLALGALAGTFLGASRIFGHQYGYDDQGRGGLGKDYTYSSHNRN